MKLTRVKELFRNTDEFAGKTVEVGGWIRTLRSSKAFGFIELSDGSFFKSVQVVFEDGKIDNYAEISKLGVGAAVIVKGNLVLTPECPGASGC